MSYFRNSTARGIIFHINLPELSLNTLLFEASDARRAATFAMLPTFAMLFLLLAPCPSAAGGAGRGRPEAACAIVDDCDWVATWGCSNDDGSDGFRCRWVLACAPCRSRAVRT